MATALRNLAGRGARRCRDGYPQPRTPSRQPWRASNARFLPHYMVALSGGVNIPCLPYRPIGGEALAQEIASHSERPSCLSHGASWNGCRWRKYRESHLESQGARKRLRTILARHSDSRASFASSKEMERIVEVFSGYGGQEETTRGSPSRPRLNQQLLM